MTQLLQFAPAVPKQAPAALATLHETVDEVIAALSTFDAGRLETLQDQVGAFTKEFLAREFAGDNPDREALPDLLRKHTLLGEMLNATAANLRVVAAVLEAKRSAAGTGNSIAIGNQDRSNLVSWPR